MSEDSQIIFIGEDCCELMETLLYHLYAVPGEDSSVEEAYQDLKNAISKAYGESIWTEVREPIIH